MIFAVASKSSIIEVRWIIDHGSSIGIHRRDQ